MAAAWTALECSFEDAAKPAKPNFLGAVHAMVVDDDSCSTCAPYSRQVSPDSQCECEGLVAEPPLLAVARMDAAAQGGSACAGSQLASALVALPHFAAAAGCSDTESGSDSGGLASRARSRIGECARRVALGGWKNKSGGYPRRPGSAELDIEVARVLSRLPHFASARCGVDDDSDEEEVNRMGMLARCLAVQRPTLH